VIGTKWVCENK
jgi:hypothetical protein